MYLSVQSVSLCYKPAYSFQNQVRNENYEVLYPSDDESCSFVEFQVRFDCSDKFAHSSTRFAMRFAALSQCRVDDRPDAHCLWYCGCGLRLDAPVVVVIEHSYAPLIIAIYIYLYIKKKKKKCFPFSMRFNSIAAPPRAAVWWHWDHPSQLHAGVSSIGGAQG